MLLRIDTVPLQLGRGRRRGGIKMAGDKERGERGCRREERREVGREKRRRMNPDKTALDTRERQNRSLIPRLSS